MANSVPGRIGSEWSKYSKYWSLMFSVGTSATKAATTARDPTRICRERDVTSCATHSTARCIGPFLSPPGTRPLVMAKTAGRTVME